MLTTLYIAGFCVAVISLSIWTLTAGRTIAGKIAPWILLTGMVCYFTAVLLAPKVPTVKLVLLFRDLGFIALCSLVIYFTRWNKILSVGLILLLLIALATWIMPLLAISI
jgi:hypothetical protein